MSSFNNNLDFGPFQTLDFDSNTNLAGGLGFGSNTSGADPANTQNLGRASSSQNLLPVPPNVQQTQAMMNLYAMVAQSQQQSVPLAVYQDLARRDEEIRQMYQKAINRSHDLQQTIDTLRAENGELQRELDHVKTNLHLGHLRKPEPSRKSSTTGSLGPNDSISRVNSTDPSVPIIIQPAYKPDKYPDEILWTITDAKEDSRVFPDGNNKSRARMEYAIRNADGSIITKKQWEVILRSATQAINLYLDMGRLKEKGLLRPGATSTMQYFTTHHYSSWITACAYIEQLHDIVGLCEGHWKAEHLLKYKLTNQRNAGKRKGSEKGSRGSQSQSDEMKESESQGTSKHMSGRETSRKKHKEPSEGSQSKRPRQNYEDSTRSSVLRNLKKKSNRSTHSTTLSTRRSTISIESQISAGINAGLSLSSDIPMSSLDLTSEPGTRNASTAISTHSNSNIPIGATKIDVSFIWIDPDLSSLQREFSCNQPSVPHALDLINAMIADPTFGSSEPSDTVKAFLDRIDGADPNSSDFDEDNSDTNWGHYQYGSGGMTVNSTLQDWKSVGNTDMACKLIAAALKTCKVARLICHKKGINATSYLSDIYLERMIERLWEVWKTAGGKIIKGKQAEGQPRGQLEQTVPSADSAPASAHPEVAVTAGDESTTPLAPISAANMALASSASAASKSMAPRTTSIPSTSTRLQEDAHASQLDAGSQEPMSISGVSANLPGAQDAEVKALRASLDVKHLTVADLKQWVTSQTTQGTSKLRSKNDWITCILENPAVRKPTPAEIRTMIGNRMTARKNAAKEKKGALDGPNQTQLPTE